MLKKTLLLAFLLTMFFTQQGSAIADEWEGFISETVTSVDSTLKAAGVAPICVFNHGNPDMILRKILQKLERKLYITKISAAGSLGGNGAGNLTPSYGVCIVVSERDPGSLADD